MERDVSSLIKPRTVAILGASGKKMAQGNTVIDNLLSRGYQGQIIPIHRDATSIQGLATVKSISDLPEGIDLAIASVPASAAAETALELEKRDVKSAIFYASGTDERTKTAIGKPSTKATSTDMAEDFMARRKFSKRAEPKKSA